MTLQEVIEALNLTVATEPREFGAVTLTGGYASDLLSCVMAGARRQGLWVTLQSHANVVAVAALLDVAAVIITENAQPAPETLARANAEGVTLLTTSAANFEVVGKLWALGVR